MATAAVPRTFDDLSVGDRLQAGPRRITREDVARFAELSGDHTALHVDEAQAAASPYGGLIAHGALVVAVATGLTHATGAFEGTVLALRSLEARFDRPVRPGDEVSLVLTVEAKQPDPPSDRGTVRLRVAVTNQAGRKVLSGLWAMVLRRRARGPETPGDAR